MDNTSDSSDVATPNLINYLASLGSLILEIDRNTCSNNLSSPDNAHTIQKFVSSSDILTVVIGINISSGDVVASCDLKACSKILKSSFAIVKVSNDSVSATKPFSQQLQMITLNSNNFISDDSNVSFLSPFQKYIQQVYTPLTRVSGGESTIDGSAQENFTTLQKRVRELDLALEQCQRGTTIPRVELPIPNVLLTAASIANVTVLRSFLEKYNPSQVDQLFEEIAIDRAMGSTPQSKEEFANEVNKSAKSWPAEISRQIRLLDSPFPGSIEREINFWKELEKKLIETKDQMDSAPLLLTKLVLKRTNRVSEQLIHEATTDLDRSLDIVQESNSFLRDFPIEDLLTASDLQPKLNRAVSSSLQHFSKLRHSKYDFSRAVRLLESLGQVVYTRILGIIKEKNILQCKIDELRSVTRHALDVFQTWESQLATVRTILKDVAKRRNEKLKTLTFELEPLQQRLQSISDFREEHDKLLNVFSNVLSGQNDDAIADLHDAYQYILRSQSDVFDTSPNGSSTWVGLRQLYEKRLEKTEDRITKLLEERLNLAKSADEMFKIFSTFNPLFFRPSIRNAVNAFRVVLVRNVRDDVKRLQEKFRFRYDESMEKITADIHDIPPLSGRIIWAKQIENQLATLMKRLENVIGAGWEDHIEGKQLKEVCDELRSYLDTNSLYNEWLSQQLRVDMQRYNRSKDFLFLVDDDYMSSPNAFLHVNFDDRQVIVFKEVRYLEWLLPTMSTTHKTIPRTIQSQSSEAYVRYPTATALQAALSGLLQARKLIDSRNELLLTSHVTAVRDVIKEAFGGSKKSKRWIKWDSPDLADWVGQLSNRIITLQERVDDVNDKITRTENLLENLRSCSYERSTLENIIQKLQQIVDEMQMKGYANVLVWVNNLDKQIEAVIQSRIQSSIASWVKSFLNVPSNYIESGDESKHLKDDSKSEPDVILDVTVHEILLSNQILYLSPPLEQARIDWFAYLAQYIAIASTLPRIVTSRFNVFADSSSVILKDFSDVISKIDKSCLSAAYSAIENTIWKASCHVQTWLQYQTLWDTSSSLISDKLGTDVSKWIQLLNDMNSSRKILDSYEDESAFGPITINQQHVINKVNLKYDSWQKDCLSKFALIIADQIKDVHAELLAAKTKLENIYLDGSTHDVIIGVEYILKMTSTLNSSRVIVSNLDTSEKLLTKQRFSFPREWLSVSAVVSVHHDLIQIHSRRQQAMNNQLASLRVKIKEEEQSIHSKLEELVTAWERERPDSGGLVVGEVLSVLDNFSGRIRELSDDISRIDSAKEALEIETQYSSSASSERLNLLNQEISALQEVWSLLSPAYDKLNVLRNITLKDIVPNKIRKGLDDIVDQMRTLPTKYKAYAAVEWFQDRINKLLNAQVVLRDLCSDALKDRHWKNLLSLLRIPKSNYSKGFSTLSLGVIWDAEILGLRKSISDILSTAQGELALEQFLKDLRESWVSYELTILVREQTLRIIGDWDVLFTTLEDNLNSLASIKQSPYFRNVPEFQEDTANWEGRLTSLRGIFEIWVEVQRKWIYLRGIFRNADIKAQLPSQYNKFKSVDSEISSLMKRVATKPQALDLLAIDNLHRQLERQDSTMTLVQKALGDYLERQRLFFPRFYFVNNDDLVEIIGNSNEPAKILPHLSKMFAAITTINIDNDTSTSQPAAMNMISKEGESVAFLSPVNVSVSVKDWLTDLQQEMRHTLASLLQTAIGDIPQQVVGDGTSNSLVTWTGKYPAQIVILASQIAWCRDCESAMLSTVGTPNDLVMSTVLTTVLSKLRFLSENILTDMTPDLRQKCEQLLTEMVHQRDITRQLVGENGNSVKSREEFSWLYHLRFYWSPKETDIMQRLSIRMSNASFFYGFEYLGIGERLVQTPLTDRCYLTLTQALHFRLGGNPFGPAGTGKTESVKMLGSQLGRFVLVFNCDASFDYAAMGRIFSGLCQVGAWGCFDEFNRLEERILSAVSQQILTIQRGLQLQLEQVEVLPGQQCKLHKDVGIFVTLNPGYAGRSNLPDNLKQLFRAVAMAVPDRKLIAQVMLFAQGIVTAEDLAGKVVLLFIMCEEQLSSQAHYDFGLRALKSVLTGAGDLKRLKLKSATGDMSSIEREVLIKATCDSIVPKLVAEDIPLFNSLLQAAFPSYTLPISSEENLVDMIHKVCAEEGFECSGAWAEKVLQLKQVVDMRHGIMLAGPSGSGKTTAWKILFKALSRLDNIKGDYFIIDPKSIKKETLYGSLDPNTLEWTDGIFTKVLRRVSDVSEGRASTNRRAWIIFDGDVDPDWAENLNSVLDDNKVLTLPNGDRLRIPSHVRIMMEVDSLKHATLATVSRCGMIWFANNTVTLDMILRHHQILYRRENLLSFNSQAQSSVAKSTQDMFVESIASSYSASGIVGVALEYALAQQHVMDPTTGRLLETLFTLITRGISLAVEYNDNNSDFPMSLNHMSTFSSKWLLYSLLWAFGGSLTNDRRAAFSDLLLENSLVDLPNGLGGKAKLLDTFVNVNDGSWLEWSTLVGPRMEIESHKVTSSDVVVNTIDTVRHTEVLRAWLSLHQPLILCGPPGSGKTMTLTALLEAMPEFILAPLNFSSGTSPELIIQTFAQYCEVVDSPDGLVLQPNRQSYRESQWLVIFCDEINLPEKDLYGTQRVIMFLRQLTEQNGYWNTDCKWISLKRIQFVGACNPPTDAGRVPLPQRFLRHAPLLLVDYPAEISLKQIYRTFAQALLKLHPNLKGFVDPLTNAMVEFYSLNQSKFTADIAPQYIYSPRELSRWVRGMYEAMEPLEAMTGEELVRLWAHEALRLFHDRLISEEERNWCNSQIDVVAAKHFAGVNIATALARPLLYSNWIRKNYQSVDIEELRQFVAQRLKVFYEEQLDVPLVIFDDVLEHVLRIDNVLRHPFGHMLLAGESGVGKTVLSRFVAWINGLSVFQIKADSRYTLEQFDVDLRALLRRVGVDGEKVCFIFDEGNALSTAFLERMNALLASGEVPGLFEGDDRAQLLIACRESLSQRAQGGTLLDSDDELWRSFTRLVQRNLHVVFTINPASADFSNRCVTSPALFNRCVVDWFGTWSQGALIQVGHEFTAHQDTGYTKYSCPSGFSGRSAIAEIFSAVLDTINVNPSGLNRDPDLHDAVVAALVIVHNNVKQKILKLNRHSLRTIYLSPRDYLDLIHNFISTETEKRSYLEDQQTHLQTGLRKLTETQDRVAELRGDMVKKDSILRQKDNEANEKLTTMVQKQNEAESRKVIVEKLTAELHVQNEEIRQRLESVESELSAAEPTLQAAKLSVSNIRRAQLDEVRILTRPPNLVRLTLEMVCVMIGEKNLDWNEIRKIIRRDDFISTVVSFDPTSLTSKQVKQVQDDYLSLAELNYDSVDHASKACGPLYLWTESQIKYAIILRKIKPLRDEVSALQLQSQELAERQQKALADLTQLEKSIQTYKAEYAAAIRDTENIRNEMTLVTQKVARAESLLHSLEQENVRWKVASVTFDEQMSTLLGDCLIAAAFQTYSGNFESTVRSDLLEDWKQALEGLGIPYRSDLDLSSYLSTPAEIMRWRGYGLSSDEVATENAIILDRCNRFPLVIDPPGQATAFLLAKYSEQRIVKTSFLDQSFFKTLASAIRFGTPLLVTDVESVDPILNPVLNKELQHTGGRTLIRLGAEEIDYSPKFFLILLTRKAYAQFPPDLCSRVTIINFSVTSASLQAQTMGAILKFERPDVEERRIAVAHLASELAVKLRDLEDKLLNQISAVEGAILDDDSVIKSLESIKSDAAAVQKEARGAAEVAADIDAISAIYTPLAKAMTSVYFCLASLPAISSLYQFSLAFFLGIVQDVLSSLGKELNGSDRIQGISMTFFREVSRRVLRALKSDDKLLFIVRISQIYSSFKAGKNTDDADLTTIEADLLYRGISPGMVSGSSNAVFLRCKEILSSISGGRYHEEAASKRLFALTTLSTFSQLLPSIEKGGLEEFIKSASPENCVPSIWLPPNISAGRKALLSVLVVQALRPDRILPALELYVETIFKSNSSATEDLLSGGLNWREYSKTNLRELVSRDSKASVPILLCSARGQDASSQIDSLASSLAGSDGVTLLQIAMGSEEGYREAERLVTQGAKTGSWVLIRNIHLCTPSWLSTFEKRLGSGMLASPHDKFRLFLTGEISLNSQLPVGLLLLSEVVIFEGSRGIKANLQRFFANLPASRTDQPPLERGRLYTLLGWLHAVIQERGRYAPFGWTKVYEHTDTDLAFALDIADQWISSSTTPIVGGHIDPKHLPWEAVKTLLRQCVYGGRIDSPWDQAALDAFVEEIVHVGMYDTPAMLIRGGSDTALTLPDSLNRQATDAWIKSLPDNNSPAWLGLPPSVETQLATLSGAKILSRLSTLLGGNDSSSDVEAHESSQTKATMLATLKGWLSQLNLAVSQAAVLSEYFDASTQTNDSAVLIRSVLRECSHAKHVASIVQSDMASLCAVLEGSIKATNATRELFSSVSRGQVPPLWKAEYEVSKDILLTLWISDLSERIRSLERYRPILKGVGYKGVYWLGGFFSSEAFITATRQVAAQTNGWSLEDLELYLEISSQGESTTNGSFVVEGLTLEGASWTASGGIALTDDLRCQLPISTFRWVNKHQAGGSTLALPVYLNENRKTVVTVTKVTVPREVSPIAWAQRGVCLLVQSVR